MPSASEVVVFDALDTVEDTSIRLEYPVWLDGNARQALEGDPVERAGIDVLPASVMSDVWGPGKTFALDGGSVVGQSIFRVRPSLVDNLHVTHGD